MEPLKDRRLIPNDPPVPHKPSNHTNEAPLSQANEGSSIIPGNSYNYPPVDLSAPHSANFKKLTEESIDVAEQHFKEKKAAVPEQSLGFWGKAKAALWGAVCYCTGLAESKLSSGEVQQASKIVSASRKFQLGISSALNSENITDFTRGNKTHLDYTLSALSSAAGLYKFLAKHGKDNTKCAKALERIVRANDELEEIYEKAEILEEHINKRLELIKKAIAEDPEKLEEYTTLLAKKETVEKQIEALTQNIAQCKNAKEREQMQDELASLQLKHLNVQKVIQDLIDPYDTDLEGEPLEALQSDLRTLNQDLCRLDHDIKRLLHESWELSKRECTTSALVFASGTKTLVSGAKYAVDYGADYDLTIRKYNKAIKSYLGTYMMTPVFVAGLGVSLYGTYTLGDNYMDRSRIQTAAQKMLSKDMDDPELEAFVSLVASRQRTTQAALSLGSTVAKVAQNAIALGVAFGGIQMASAATGIDESTLELVITPATWLIGGAVACTSIGLKTYQNYKEACRQEEEAYWVQVLLDTKGDKRAQSLSDGYLKLAEEIITEQDDHYYPGEDNLHGYIDEMREELNLDLRIRNKAVLSLMKLNPDFAVGVIYARLNSMEEEVREGTADMLLKLGLNPTDIEEVIKLSPQLACNLIKEKLCLL